MLCAIAASYRHGTVLALHGLLHRCSPRGVHIRPARPHTLRQWGPLCEVPGGLRLNPSSAAAACQQFQRHPPSAAPRAPVRGARAAAQAHYSTARTPRRRPPRVCVGAA